MRYLAHCKNNSTQVDCRYALFSLLPVATCSEPAIGLDAEKHASLLDRPSQFADTDLHNDCHTLSSIPLHRPTVQAILVDQTESACQVQSDADISDIKKARDLVLSKSASTLSNRSRGRLDHATLLDTQLELSAGNGIYPTLAARLWMRYC